jgi:hypothetical protein
MSCAGTTRHTSAGAGCFGGLSVPAHPDGGRSARSGCQTVGTMLLTGGTLGLRAAAAMRGSMRALGAPSPDFGCGGSAEAPPDWGRRPRARERRRGSTCRAAAAAAGIDPDARRGSGCGGSAEPPPDWGRRLRAREGRPGLTCCAAAAAVGHSRVGTSFAAPRASRRRPLHPELGSNGRPLTAAAPANRDAPATPAPAGSTRRARPGGRGHLAWRQPGRPGQTRQLGRPAPRRQPSPALAT